MPKESGKMNQREREICTRMKQFREQIKWPQAAFAFELGTTKDQLASIEYQRTPMRYDVGYRVCLIFDVSPEWLATGNSPVTLKSRLDYPISRSLPKMILFSEVFDSFAEKGGAAMIVKTKSGAEKELREESQSGAAQLDDPTGFFMDRLLEVLRGEKFEKPVIRDQFIFDVVKMAKTIAMDYRVRRVKTQVRLGAGFNPREADLSKVPVAKVKKLLVLKKKIEHLQAQLLMLEDECGLSVSGAALATPKHPPA